MQRPWLDLLDRLLRPARPDLVRYAAEREEHLAQRRQRNELRSRAVVSCEARINQARASVFAADDGVVGSQMTALEREWRALSREDLDLGMMDLWARIAPPAWLDRKRWRDSSPESWPEAAVLLAADVAGVEAAERAVLALRGLLAGHGTPLAARIHWRLGEQDFQCAAKLLKNPLETAKAACSTHRLPAILERATRLELSVLEAALGRFPARPGLARDLAHAAFVDLVWRAASLADATNPVTPLWSLWQTGYVLSDCDNTSVTLEICGAV